MLQSLVNTWEAKTNVSGWIPLVLCYLVVIALLRLVFVKLLGKKQDEELTRPKVENLVILGSKGSGKSRMLRYLATGDAKADRNQFGSTSGGWATILGSEELVFECPSHQNEAVIMAVRHAKTIGFCQPSVITGKSQAAVSEAARLIVDLATREDLRKTLSSVRFVLILTKSDSPLADPEAEVIDLLNRECQVAWTAISAQTDGICRKALSPKFDVRRNQVYAQTVIETFSGKPSDSLVKTLTKG